MPLQGEFFQNPGGASGFYDHEISQSLRIDSQGDFLDSTNFSAGASEKYTVSAWVKRSGLARYQAIVGGSAGNWTFGFQSDDTIRISSHTTVQTTGLFRDISGWYHIVAQNGPNSGDGAIYVNGVSQTLSSNTFNSNSGMFRSGQSLQIGQSNDGGYAYNFDGYIAEVYGFSNQTIAPTALGESKNGVWIPKEYTGSFGDSQDFYLKFASGAIGTDSSGNGNNFSTVGTLGADHIVLDSPTFGE